MHRHAKTLTFSNISVITDHSYLKLRLIVSIKRGTHTSRGGNPQNFSDIVLPLFSIF